MTARVRTPPGAEDDQAELAQDFGRFLLDSGVLSAGALDRARYAAAVSGDRFDSVLGKLGLMPDTRLAESLSAYLGLALFTLGEAPLPLLLADKLSRSFLIENRLLPVRETSDTLTFAVVDPLDRFAIQALRFVTPKAIVVEVITLSDFQRAIARLHGSAATTGDLPPATLDDTVSESDLEHLRDSASEAPVIRLVEQMVADAVEGRASDIYVEPSATALLVRNRVDGVLRVTHTLPGAMRAAIVSRIKILAKLDIAERRLPQDGRITLVVRGQSIEFRIATIPTIDGEAVTMRVLDRSRVDLDFAQLGFDEGKIRAMHDVMEHPNGIVLVTGPTGSGKTTTLYTMLKHINRLSTKIFTVEDPIEYQLPGISQVQVHDAIGLNFPTVLRSILRHRPDQIMIGEIRDRDTAAIAVQASLTSHLVLSTLPHQQRRGDDHAAARHGHRALPAGVDRACHHRATAAASPLRVLFAAAPRSRNSRTSVRPGPIGNTAGAAMPRGLPGVRGNRLRRPAVDRRDDADRARAAPCHPDAQVRGRDPPDR